MLLLGHNDIDHDKGGTKGEKYGIGKQHGQMYVNTSPKLSSLKL